MANSELGYKSSTSLYNVAGVQTAISSGVRTFLSGAMVAGTVDVVLPYFVQGQSKIISLTVGTPGAGVGGGYLYTTITGAGAIGAPTTLMTIRSSVNTETSTVVITYIL